MSITQSKARRWLRATENASPGPWKARTAPGFPLRIHSRGPGEEGPAICTLDGPDDETAGADACFLVAAREAMPRLLTEPFWVPIGPEARLPRENQTVLLAVEGRAEPVVVTFSHYRNEPHWGGGAVGQSHVLAGAAVAPGRLARASARPAGRCIARGNPGVVPYQILGNHPIAALANLPAGGYCSRTCWSVIAHFPLVFASETSASKPSTS